MKRLIILEGPDGAGKTTLGEKLATMLGVPISNHGPYKGEGQIWMRYFDSMVPYYKGERHVILDRCWLAEPVYGAVYRGGTNRIEPWQKRILNHVANSGSVMLVWCLPPVEKCLEAFRSRRQLEMLDSEQQLRDVYFEYVKAAANEQGIFNRTVYDYTRGPWGGCEWLEELHASYLDGFGAVL